MYGPGRRRPYTASGIRRLPCTRCGAKPSYATWQLCADGRLHRPFCKACDIKINAKMMRWVWGDRREADLAAYVKKLADEV
jgi:hypothetical protein